MSKRTSPAIAAAMATIVAIGALAATGAAAQSQHAELAFDGQSSGGRVVTVQNLSLPESGFVAIHDATLLSDEDPFGSVIGVSEALPAGEYADVRVTLSRALVAPNETLVAMPHKDTNANGIYDFVSSQGAEDGPFETGPQATDTFAGTIVVAPAVVNATATVRATSPQPSAGTSVRVDAVDMVEGGFLAVHDETLVSEEDPLGSVVGVSAFLEPGLHRDVLVTLDFDGREEPVKGSVILMPHKDTNGNRAYDFVSSQGADDGPYAGDVSTFAGDIVIQAVELKHTETASVTFVDTSTGGGAVVVPEAFLPTDGFVAIHDSTLVSEEDPFGSVIGVSEALPAGLHRNVTVEFGSVNGNDKNFTEEANDTLIAMPHQDSNANGEYDFVTSQGAEDGPFVGGPAASETFVGNIVIAAATVTRSAGVVATDQINEDGDTVVVDLVDLSEDGFLALHDITLVSEEDPFGSVVGVSDPLPAGLHRNVTVSIGQNAPGATKTDALNVSQTLVAMPHVDSNANGTYDFITSQGAEDGPFPGTVPTFVGNLSIAVFRVTLPVTTASAEPTPTPATPTPATPTPDTEPTMQPDANEDEEQEARGVPGFGPALALAALGVAVLVVGVARRRTR